MPHKFAGSQTAASPLYKSFQIARNEGSHEQLQSRKPSYKLAVWTNNDILKYLWLGNVEMWKLHWFVVLVQGAW